MSRRILGFVPICVLIAALTATVPTTLAQGAATRHDGASWTATAGAVRPAFMTTRTIALERATEVLG